MEPRFAFLSPNILFCSWTMKRDMLSLKKKNNWRSALPLDKPNTHSMSLLLRRDRDRTQLPSSQLGDCGVAQESTIIASAQPRPARRPNKPGRPACPLRPACLASDRNPFPGVERYPPFTITVTRRDLWWAVTQRDPLRERASVSLAQCAGVPNILQAFGAGKFSVPDLVIRC